jgi:hypothetical protein
MDSLKDVKEWLRRANGNLARAQSGRIDQMSFLSPIRRYPVNFFEDNIQIFCTLKCGGLNVLNGSHQENYSPSRGMRRYGKRLDRS